MAERLAPECGMFTLKQRQHFLTSLCQVSLEERLPTTPQKQELGALSMTFFCHISSVVYNYCSCFAFMQFSVIMNPDDILTLSLIHI